MRLNLKMVEHNASTEQPLYKVSIAWTGAAPRIDVDSEALVYADTPSDAKVKALNEFFTLGISNREFFSGRLSVFCEVDDE